jgi:hypothetical protein
LALASVEVAFAREQPFAEKVVPADDAAALEEVGVVGREHALDVLRVVEQIDVPPPDLEVDDVAVFARHPLHEPERVALAGEV